MSTKFFHSNNNLERFRKYTVGKKADVKDIDSKFAPSGDLRELFGIDVIVKSIQRLLLIQAGTYLFDPPLGVGLHLRIFEPCDNRSKTEIAKEIKEQIRRYETRGKIGVNVIPLSNQKGFRVDIEIKYEGETRHVREVYDESLLRTMD